MITPAIRHAMNYAIPGDSAHKEHAYDMDREDLIDELARSHNEASADEKVVAESGTDGKFVLAAAIRRLLYMMRITTRYTKHYSTDVMRLIYIIHMEYDTILETCYISISEFNEPDYVLSCKLSKFAYYENKLLRLSSALDAILNVHPFDQSHEYLKDLELADGTPYPVTTLY